MWQRFSSDARQTILYAQEEAKKRHEHLVDTEHLLLGVLRQLGTPFCSILDRAGLPTEPLKSELEERICPDGGSQSAEFKLTRNAVRAIDLAYSEARQLRHPNIKTSHLLLGIIRTEAGLTGEVLSKFDINVENLRQGINEQIASEKAERAPLKFLRRKFRQPPPKEPTSER